MIRRTQLATTVAAALSLVVALRGALAQQDLVAPTAAQGNASVLGPAVQLTPQRTWYAKAAPLTVSVGLDGLTDEVALVLLDADGAQLARVDTRAPSLDLRMAMPEVLSITRAAYLQGLVRGEAVGTPLVVEPLRTPRRVRTREEIDATGATRTVVIGWDGEPLPDATPADRAAMKEGVQYEPQITAGFHMAPEEDLLLSTDRGDLRIAFSHDEAPATGANMRRLASEGFYDGLTFHRIASVDRSGRPFVVQGGDPAGTGDGTPGYAITLEESGLPFDFGVLGMARADDPHSVGCQFFIALGREGTARLDGKYSAFAYCVEGEPTIRALESVAIEDPETQRPVVAPRILSARLVPAPPRSPGISRLTHRVQRTDAASAPTHR